VLLFDCVIILSQGGGSPEYRGKEILIMTQDMKKQLLQNSLEQICAIYPDETAIVFAKIAVTAAITVLQEYEKLSAE